MPLPAPLRRILTQFFKLCGYRVIARSIPGIDILDDLQQIAPLNPQIIFDIGAYHGGSSQRLRSRFPHAQIYSFEPFPASYAIAKEALKHDTRLRLIPSALGAHVGQQEFYCFNDPNANSFSPASQFVKRYDYCRSFNFEANIQVNVDTIDTFCQKEEINQIDILKIEAQSAELAILQGAESLLKRHAIKVIRLEILFAPYYRDQPEPTAIISRLAHYGYRLIDLYDPIRSRNLAIDCCEALFIPEAG